MTVTYGYQCESVAKLLQPKVPMAMNYMQELIKLQFNLTTSHQLHSHVLYQYRSSGQDATYGMSRDLYETLINCRDIN